MLNVAHCLDCLDFVEQDLGIVDETHKKYQPALFVVNSVAERKKDKEVCPSCGAALEELSYKLCMICGWEEYPF